MATVPSALAELCHPPAPPYLLLYHPVCSASPSRAWMSSDLERHPHLPTAWALRRRPSGPRVPAVGRPLSFCSYGSVTIQQNHVGLPPPTPPSPPMVPPKTLSSANCAHVSVTKPEQKTNRYFIQR